MATSIVLRFTVNSPYSHVWYGSDRSGAICLWSHGHLTVLQQASFPKLLVGVLAAMCLMAVSQQTAIWGAGAGWALVGVLGATALACLAALARTATRQAV